MPKHLIIKYLYIQSNVDKYYKTKLRITFCTCPHSENLKMKNRILDIKVQHYVQMEIKMKTDWFKITGSWTVWFWLGSELWKGIFAIEIKLNAISINKMITKAMEVKREATRRERGGGGREKRRKGRGEEERWGRRAEDHH